VIENRSHNPYNLDTNNKGLRYVRRLACPEISLLCGMCELETKLNEDDVSSPGGYQEKQLAPVKRCTQEQVVQIYCFCRVQASEESEGYQTLEVGGFS
jgi:hypothetical protein